MKPVFRYLSHPQVNIDPATPVPKWGLSDVGRARCEAVAKALSLKNTKTIISSDETKALETASFFSKALGIETTVRPKSHENDRSATGYLKGQEFEGAANQFFAHPQQSFRGWERAVDAQARIVAEAHSVIASSDLGDILMIGHGGVGTLLYCHFAGLPIQRIQDQPAGGGNCWAMTMPDCKIVHGWKSMESV